MPLCKSSQSAERQARTVELQAQIIQQRAQGIERLLSTTERQQQSFFYDSTSVAGNNSQCKLTWSNEKK